jgi:glucose-6-phosphate isomerase
VAFVANVDPVALDRALAGLDPRATLFVVASKGFTTQETLANARAARTWLEAALPPGADARRHFVAATASVEAAAAFGVPADAILPFHEGVGGRFSLWSPVGVTIAAALGNDAHDELFAGAHAMDRHFASAPFDANLPVVLALAGLWNAPALWGGIGTDGQHAFFQWLHQGTDVVPVEFIVPAVPVRGDPTRHALLVANALAQAQALALGRSPEAVAAELEKRGLAASATAVAVRVCPGDRPSTTIVTPRLDARTLGALLALYEHRTFVEGILWGINPFDQFGVELGKILADPIVAALVDGSELAPGTDASTRALVAHVRSLMQREPGSD